MQLNFKTFLAKYGVLFIVGFMGSFIAIVNLSKKATLPLLPGDILIKQSEFTLYFPFGSSIAFGIGAVFMYELYKYIRP